MQCRLGSRGLFTVIAEMKDRGPRPAAPGYDITRQIAQDRYYAAWVLEKIADRRAVPALIEALQDGAINYQTAIVLAHLGDARAVPALLATLERAKNVRSKSCQSDMRLYAAYGLLGLRHPAGLRTLMEFVKGKHDGELRRPDASDAASQRAHAEAASWQRQFAAEALAEFGGRDAVPALIEAARHDKDVGVRVDATVALGNIGDEAAAPALRALLGDDSAETGRARLRYDPPLFKQMTVREAASQAIEQMKRKIRSPAFVGRTVVTVPESGPPPQVMVELEPREKTPPANPDEDRKKSSGGRP